MPFKIRFSMLNQRTGNWIELEGQAIKDYQVAAITCQAGEVEQAKADLFKATGKVANVAHATRTGRAWYVGFSRNQDAGVSVEEAAAILNPAPPAA